MTEQHFIDLTSAEETVRHLFDTTRAQVILVDQTQDIDVRFKTVCVFELDN